MTPGQAGAAAFTPGRAVPVPEHGIVDLWCLPLNPDGSAERRAALLGDDERARAARFRFARDRDRWTVGRGGLREVLSAYVGVAPEEIRLAYGPQGKPELEFPTAELSFNLAHCDDLAVMAVRRGAAVGVDVERVRPVPDAVSIASRFFSARERDAVLNGTAGVAERFFACWTRKEAVIKATGLGLGDGLDRFAVSVPPDDPPRVVWVDGDASEAGSWSLAPFAPAPGFVGAVAVQAPLRLLRLRWWGG